MTSDIGRDSSYIHRYHHDVEAMSNVVVGDRVVHFSYSFEHSNYLLLRHMRPRGVGFNLFEEVEPWRRLVRCILVANESEVKFLSRIFLFLLLFI